MTTLAYLAIYLLGVWCGGTLAYIRIVRRSRDLDRLIGHYQEQLLELHHQIDTVAGERSRLIAEQQRHRRPGDHR